MVTSASTLNEVPTHVTVLYIFFQTYLPPHQPYAIGHDLLVGI